MEYAAVALAILGVAIGILFRLKVLLPIIGVLLLASIAFSLVAGYSFLDAASTMLVAQTILQGSYFVGLLLRAAFTAAHRNGPVL
jgi:hypothetical protein